MKLLEIKAALGRILKATFKTTFNPQDTAQIRTLLHTIVSFAYSTTDHVLLLSISRSCHGSLSKGPVSK